MKLNIKLKILGILILLILLSVIYPIIYSYSDKSLPPLPFYTTYDKALEMIADSIRVKAAEFHCRNYVLPLEDVESPNQSLDFLRIDLNIALATYPSWKERVDEKEKREMIKRQVQINKEWGAMYTGDEFTNMLSRLKSVALRTRYTTSAKWVYLNNIDSSNDNDVKVILSVNDNSTRSEVFEVSQTFIHPDTLSKIINYRKKEATHLLYIKNLSEISLKTMFGFSFLFLLAIVSFVGESLYKKNKRKKIEEFLLSEISKREILINEGHFVTAFELTEKYLEYFPEDTEIKAFKERLLDFTNNNPKAAQEAYVMAKKLQKRFGEHLNETTKLLLSREENDSIKVLLPYNSELDRIYNQVALHDEQLRADNEINESINRIMWHVHNGEIYTALKMLKSAESQLGEVPRLIDLKPQITNRKHECEKEYLRIRELFCNGKIKGGVESLNQFLNLYKDHLDSQRLSEEIINAKKLNKFRLTISEMNLEVLLIFKNRVTFGRKDYTNSPDIQFTDKRISRSHLSVVRKGENWIVQDEHSAGDTFLNGEKVTMALLNDEDILNLSKVLQLKVTLKRDGEDVIDSIMLNNKEYNIFIVTDKLVFKIDDGELTIDRGGYKIFYREMIPIITWQNNFEVIFEKEVNLGAQNIKIEFL